MLVYAGREGQVTLSENSMSAGQPASSTNEPAPVVPGLEGDLKSFRFDRGDGFQFVVRDTPLPSEDR